MGSAAGSERVRRAETPAPRIGGGGWRTPQLGPFEGSPWGLKDVCQAVQKGTRWRGEKGVGAPCLGELVWRPGVPKSGGRRGRGSGRRVFWEVAWTPFGLLFKNWQSKSGGPRFKI